jgi:hypothetical protein
MHKASHISDGNKGRVGVKKGEGRNEERKRESEKEGRERIKNMHSTTHQIPTAVQFDLVFGRCPVQISPRTPINIFYLFVIFLAPSTVISELAP